MVSQHVVFTVCIIMVSIVIVIWLSADGGTPEEKDVAVTGRTLGIYVSILFATILLWRGVSNLMDDYFFPGHDFTDAAVSILIGVVILALAIHVAPSAVLQYNKTEA